MADFNSNYVDSDSYMIGGDLLNRMANKHNEDSLINPVSHTNKGSLNKDPAPSNNPILNDGQIGVAELITNNPAEARQQDGTVFGTGINATGRPFVSPVVNNTWYVRFVHMQGSSPQVSKLIATLDSSLYAFSQRNGQTGNNEGAYGQGSPNTGQMPLFAPGDKIPCIFYPQQGALVPLVSPPEEVGYFDFGTGAEPLNQSITKSSDLFDTGEVAVRLEWYDPDLKKWFFYRDRVIHIPKDVFGERGASISMSMPMSILMKDDVAFRVTCAKSIEDDERTYVVSHWGCSVKALGRHWRTDPILFPFQNPNVLYDYLVSYEADENRIEVTSPWTQCGGTKGLANTKERWKDGVRLKNVAEGMLFSVLKPNGIRWNWTCEVNLSVIVSVGETLSSQSPSSISGTTSDNSETSPSSSTVLKSSSSTGDVSSSQSQSETSTQYLSTSSTVGLTTSSTVGQTTSSTVGLTTSSTQLESSSQILTTSSTQFQTTSSTIALTTSSTERFSTSGTGSSSTESLCCITVVTDIKCDDEGHVVEVCKTRFCWPMYVLTPANDGLIAVKENCKIFS